jgi:hypothetical protein
MALENDDHEFLHYLHFLQTKSPGLYSRDERWVLPNLTLCTTTPQPNTPKEYLMSTQYRPLSPIYVGDPPQWKREKIRAHEGPHGPFNRCLTDDHNFLWVDFNAEGQVTSFTRNAENFAQGILGAIGEALDVEIVCEHDPRFWGLETEEEWDAAWNAIAEEQEQEFYDEVMKFIRGERNGIMPGTIGMMQAEIAKRLAVESPDFLVAGNRPALIKAVKTMYDRDHTAQVQLNEVDKAFARMRITPEDDLPQA